MVRGGFLEKMDRAMGTPRKGGTKAWKQMRVWLKGNGELRLVRDRAERVAWHSEVLSSVSQDKTKETWRTCCVTVGKSLNHSECPHLRTSRRRQLPPGVHSWGPSSARVLSGHLRLP